MTVTSPDKIVTFTDEGWEAWREIVAGMLPKPKGYHTSVGRAKDGANTTVRTSGGTIPYGDAQRTQLRGRLCKLRAEGLVDFPRENISTPTLKSIISMAKKENGRPEKEDVTEDEDVDKDTPWDTLWN